MLDVTAAKNALNAIIQPASAEIDALIGKAQSEVEAIQSVMQGEIDALKAQIAAIPPPLTSISNLSDLQAHYDWKIGVSKDIAPMNTGLVQGVDFGFRQVAKPNSPIAVELFFSRALAGDYSGFLISLHRDLNTSAAKLRWRGRFYHDDKALGGMQALEFDTRLSKDNLNYNLSSQINYAKGGMLQIVNDASGTKGWQDSGIVLGKPTANEWHEFEWEYWYNTTTQTFGYTAFNLDGKRYPISGAFTSENATTPDWGKPFRIHTQLQIGTNNKGIPFAVAFDRLNYLLG